MFVKKTGSATQTPFELTNEFETSQTFQSPVIINGRSELKLIALCIVSNIFAPISAWMAMLCEAIPLKVSINFPNGRPLRFVSIIDFVFSFRNFNFVRMCISFLLINVSLQQQKKRKRGKICMYVTNKLKNHWINLKNSVTIRLLHYL